MKPRIAIPIPNSIKPDYAMRALPQYHRALIEAGYVTPELEYENYPSLWRALRSRAA